MSYSVIWYFQLANEYIQSYSLQVDVISYLVIDMFSIEQMIVDDIKIYQSDF